MGGGGGGREGQLLAFKIALLRFHFQNNRDILLFEWNFINVGLCKFGAVSPKSG